MNIEGHVPVPDTRHPKQVRMYYGPGTVAERTNDVTRARRASGQPTDADATAGGRHGHGHHLDVMSKIRLVNPCVFTFRKK